MDSVCALTIAAHLLEAVAYAEARRALVKSGSERGGELARRASADGLKAARLRKRVLLLRRREVNRLMSYRQAPLLRVLICAHLDYNFILRSRERLIG